MPLVSVIVPVFSGEDLLRRCIDSIRAQSLTDFELILVDDGSYDGCGKTCDEYAMFDHRIKVLHQKNGGVSVARNSGLKLATGKYITFCDGDDYYCEELLKTAYEAIVNSDSDMVSYHMKRLSGMHESIGYVSYDDSYDLNEGNRFEYIYKVIRRETGGWQVCRSMFRNAIIRDHNIEFCTTCHNYAEDLGFTVEFLFYSGKVSYINEELYIYDDRRETSMMNTSKNVCRINDINELSYYLYNKAIAIYPSIDYFLIHHYLIRSHIIDAYKAVTIEEFMKWVDAIDSVNNKDYFMSQNRLYFVWMKKQKKKLPIKTRIKSLRNTEYAVDQYLADKNLSALRRHLNTGRRIRKLIEVFYEC